MLRPPNWHKLNFVRSGAELSFGERTADRMKASLANWPALISVLGFIGVWLYTNGLGVDSPPWILLNLMLSCFAALQCFVLLIAAKRGERIAYEIAKATLDEVRNMRGEHQALLQMMHRHDVDARTGEIPD